MHRRQAPTPDSGRRRLAWLVVLCAALACATPERNASFPLRGKIPFGVFSVSVDGWEQVGSGHAPLSSLRAPEGEKAIAVFVGWSGLESFAEPDRQVFAEAFLSGRLKLVDSDGIGYRAISAMPREQYYFFGHGVAAPRDWVVVFHVRQVSRAYTLRLSHPDGGKASFDAAVVSLG